MIDAAFLRQCLVLMFVMMGRDVPLMDRAESTTACSLLCLCALGLLYQGMMVQPVFVRILFDKVLKCQISFNLKESRGAGVVFS